MKAMPALDPDRIRRPLPPLSESAVKSTLDAAASSKETDTGTKPVLPTLSAPKFMSQFSFPTSHGGQLNTPFMPQSAFLNQGGQMNVPRPPFVFNAQQFLPQVYTNAFESYANPQGFNCNTIQEVSSLDGSRDFEWKAPDAPRNALGSMTMDATCPTPFATCQPCSETSFTDSANEREAKPSFPRISSEKSIDWSVTANFLCSTIESSALGKGPDENFSLEFDSDPLPLSSLKPESRPSVFSPAPDTDIFNSDAFDWGIEDDSEQAEVTVDADISNISPRHDDAVLAEYQALSRRILQSMIAENNGIGASSGLSLW